jgi:hypothetical protein
MVPSNDYARPPASASRRNARAVAVAAVVAAALGASWWTVAQIQLGVWPIARAASLFPGGADDETPLPRYASGALLRPADYERWIAVGASLGLSYAGGSSPHEAFHQVFIAPHAFDAFRKTGTFPEGTLLVLELREAGRRVLPARGGLFAGERVGVEAAVKDTRATPEGWAYYSFGDGSRDTARPFPASACFSCHNAHAGTDNVFTQFYPRLRRGQVEP